MFDFFKSPLLQRYFKNVTNESTQLYLLGNSESTALLSKQTVAAEANLIFDSELPSNKLGSFICAIF